MQVDF